MVAGFLEPAGGCSMKALIFDSGPLINLTMNGLLHVLEELKKNFDGKFLITPQVKYEVLDRPIDVARFELGALQIKKLIDIGVLELPSSTGISDELIEKITSRLMEKANHYLMFKGQWINIVSKAEMSCLALSYELSNLSIENLIAIDERTTRLLAENPKDLSKLMSSRMHQDIQAVSQDFEVFSHFKFIRSSELVYVAHKKGILHLGSNPKVLEAALYATKYKGSSISFEEIDKLKKL